MKNKIINNIFYNVLYRLLNIIYPLLTSAYVARILLSDGVGKVSYAQNIVTYFTFIASLGLPIYGTREVAKICKKREKNNKLFTELFLINFISTFLCVVVYYSMITFFPAFSNNYKLFCVTGLTIVLNFFNVDWYYQGKEEFKYIALRSIIIKTISVICVFVFVKSHDDYIIYSMTQVFVLAGNYIINIFGLRNQVSLSFSNLNLKKHLRPLFVLFASNLAIELYTLLDTTMLGIICNDSVVGYYTYAMKISKITITLLAAISAVLLPRLSVYNVNGEKEKYKNLVIFMLKLFKFLTIPIAIAMCLLSKEIILFMFGNGFYRSISTLKILSFLVIPITYSTFLGGQVLCSLEMEKYMFYGVSVGAISNMIMNLILIPLYKQNGAAIASLISEIMVMTVDFYYLKKNVGIDIKSFMSIGNIIASILMAIIIIIVKFLCNSIILKCLLSFIFGSMTYIFMCFLLKDEIVLFFGNFIVKKFK